MVLKSYILSVLVIAVSTLSTTFVPPSCPFNSAYACSLCIYQLDDSKGWKINCDNKNLGFFPDILPDTVIDSLSLSHNSITNISFSTLRDIKSIKQLHLQVNHFPSTQFLKHESLGSLEYLDLSTNWELRNSAVIYKHFKHLTNLKTLKISENDLISLDFLNDTDSTGLLSSLERLFVSNSNLGQDSSILPSFFNGKTKLKIIMAAASKINNIDFLNSVSLNGLKTLDLSRNDIKSVRKSQLRYLDSLEVFRINDNLLTTLEVKVLDSLLPILTRFDWGGNPVSCDCRISWVKTWMQNRTTVTLINDAALQNCPVYQDPSICDGGFPTLPNSTTQMLGTTQTPDTPLTTPASTSSSTTTKQSGKSNPRPPSQMTTTSPPTSLSLDLIIVIIVVSGVVILITIIVVVVCNKKRRASQKERTTANARGYTPQDGVYYAEHYYSLPEGDRPGSLGDRPLPPKPSEFSGSVKYDAAGYLQPQVSTPSANAGVYLNPRENDAGYLQPVSEELKAEVSKEQAEIDNGYMEFNSRQSDGTYETLKTRENSQSAHDGHYTALSDRENSQSAHDEHYTPLPNTGEDNPEYQAIKGNERTSVPGVDNFGYS